MNLFDNTLRDGGNVVGHGFPADLTVSIVKGLLDAVLCMVIYKPLSPILHGRK